MADDLKATTSASAPVQLSSDEVAAILRRAAEIESDLEAARGGPPDRIDLAAVEQAAAEVGISSEAVRRAHAELRVGGLAGGPEEGGIIGPPTVAEQRVVDLPLDEARDRIGRWLRQQTFELRRSSDAASRWKRREDMSASMRRTFDFSKRIKLTDARSVTVQLTEVVDRDDRPATLVRLEADIGQIRTGAAVGAVAGAVTAGAAVGLVGAAVGAPVLASDASEFVAWWAVGSAALTPAGLGIARRGYRRKRENVGEVLGMFLDQLG
jgi:hypothetical protein